MKKKTHKIMNNLFETRKIQLVQKKCYHNIKKYTNYMKIKLENYFIRNITFLQKNFFSKLKCLKFKKQLGFLKNEELFRRSF